MSTPRPTADELLAQTHSFFGWYHTIELAPGVLTPGNKPLAVQRREWDLMQLPDLAGRSFLDVGGVDGWYAFEAERRGARRVAVLDHYLWSVDLLAAHEHFETLRARGETPGGFAWPGTAFWKPDELPGKRRFDFARDVLGSSAEGIAVDFMECDLEAVGVWDVVLYLGVLYHMEDPIRALRRLRAVTRELAVVETEIAFYPDRPGETMWRFFPFSELNNDESNWWASSLPGLLGALGAVGFSRAEVMFGWPSEAVPKGPPGYRRALMRWRRMRGRARWELPSLVDDPPVVVGNGPHQHRAIVRAWV
jgi:tRNA (mo5U34)-methyltransferase